MADPSRMPDSQRGVPYPSRRRPLGLAVRGPIRVRPTDVVLPALTMTGAAYTSKFADPIAVLGEDNALRYRVFVEVDSDEERQKANDDAREFVRYMNARSRSPQAIKTLQAAAIQSA
jgi:hypothetical protein